MKRQLLAVVLNRVTLLPGNGFDELPFMSERQPKLQDLPHLVCLNFISLVGS